MFKTFLVFAMLLAAQAQAATLFNLKFKMGGAVFASCDQSAKELGKRFTEETGLPIYDIQSTNGAEKNAYVCDTTITYAANSQVDSYRLLARGNLKDCNTSLNVMTGAIEQKMGKAAFSSSCSYRKIDGNYDLEVLMLGKLTNPPVLMDVEYGPEKMEAGKIPQMVKELGGTDVVTLMNSMFYFSPTGKPLTFEILGGFMDPGANYFPDSVQCEAQLEEMIQFVGKLGYKKVRGLCVGFGVRFLVDKDSYLINPRDHFVSQDAPKKYSTLNECQNDKTRVREFYRQNLGFAADHLFCFSTNPGYRIQLEKL